MTTMFLLVTTFGGLNAYRIVSTNNVNTIPAIESANVSGNIFEIALVENTKDDVVYSENIKYLAAKIIDAVSTSGDKLEVVMHNQNMDSYKDKVSSRGNFIREKTEEENPLLSTVITEIKELSEKKTEIINAENLNSEYSANLTKETIIENTDIKEADMVENAEKNTEKITEKNTEKSTEKNMIKEIKQNPPTAYLKTIDVKATAYCLCKKCCGKSPSNPAYGVTASGLKIVPGTNMKVVASDPSVIPLGTNVYIEGLYGAKDYGYAVVADTGSAIKNLKIDLYMDTHQMALNWGVKTVRVYILED